MVREAAGHDRRRPAHSRPPGQEHPDHARRPRRRRVVIATLVPASGQLVRLYNPRTDHWADRFTLDRNRLTIAPRTDIGAATANLLNLNDPHRLAERQLLAAA